MNIGEKISASRKVIGLSQSDLAHLSGVSVPSIANIELNRANPSIEILEKLFEPLGLKLLIGHSPLNIDKLCALGLPLTAKTIESIPTEEKKNTLICELNKAMEIYNELEARERETILALVLCIKLHYPSFYKKYLYKIDNLNYKKIDGKIIKLVNLCQAKLAEYL